MKITLKSIELHGGHQSKATGWMFRPGFVLLKFTDGTHRYMGDISYNEALEKTKVSGVDCDDFEKLQADAEKARSYPPKPESELYYHNYGYEKPVELGEWCWSITFSRWGRSVKFADGWDGFTWPQS